MAIELRQSLRLTQQLVMTPQLQQAIKLLQLSRLELAEAIQQELEENPALTDTPPEETDADFLSKNQDKDSQQEQPEINTAEQNKEIEIGDKVESSEDWANYLNEFNSTGKAHFERESRTATNFEAFTASKTSLEDHLLWQFLMLGPEEWEKEIASEIIGNIDNDGYLVTPLEDIVESTQSDLQEVEDILSIIQTFDPVGICARDLSECLLIQIRHLGIKNPVVEKIVLNHMKNLENKNYKAISKDLKISIKGVVNAVEIIRELEPKPGREFSSEEPVYIIPDIYVYKTDDDFVIVQNDDGLPKIRTTDLFKRTRERGDKVPEEAKEYLNKKMQSASWLIKSIEQRKKTIFNVMTSILKFQRDFFEKGIAHLKPMVLRDVAEDIEMHESTISRVTTNKYAFTPQGIFELKYFFNSSINRVHGEAIASASVQDKIKQIISQEDTVKPYSDEKISQLLKEANVNIARRTVAKYREILRILPSSKRKTF